MKKIILMLSLGILAIGCSSNQDAAPDPIPAPTLDYKLIIDGVEFDYPNTDGGVSGYSAYKSGDIITINASHGNLAQSNATFGMSMQFTTAGKFVTGQLSFNSYNSGHPVYSSFYDFPSHYIETTDFSIDEATHKIKLKFSGRLYGNEKQLSSESRDVYGEVDMTYIDNGPNQYPLVINNIEQYCRADFNGTPWMARFEDPYSSFTNEDEYKIEIKFANAPNPASYNFTPTSTTNYVRLAKFNTATATYDYYDATGVVAYSYREFHGFTNYSFIGTFSFTAVNPNNTADVIEVTNGTFRSYQQF